SENLNNVLLTLSENPLVLSLDISFIDSLVSRLINQFSAIPTLVGLLSLLAAAVAMANTVSLATLERRRTIGVLKAVGLKGGRILRIMLLENTLIGLLGGLLGIGLSALGVALMTTLGQGVPIPVPREAAPVAIALVIAAIAIAWTATFLSARPAVSEPVNNVLRYE
ncbi:MAG TPA: FtsX-like permease family protein, partial [Oceanobacillus sp.]|nr:FtsX-like permease family protein [Oceanobacillus sp.]